MEKIIVDKNLMVSALTEESGRTGVVIAVQNDTGGHLISLAPGNLGGPIVINTFPRAITILEWIRDDTYAYWTSRVAKEGIQPTTVPTIRIDVIDRTLEVFHSLESEIVMSIAGGPWVPYAGIIDIGLIDRPEGYWRFKIKEGVDRLESAIARSLPVSATREGFPYVLPAKLS